MICEDHFSSQGCFQFPHLKKRGSGGGRIVTMPGSWPWVLLTCSTHTGAWLCFTSRNMWPECRKWPQQAIHGRKGCFSSKTVLLKVSCNESLGFRGGIRSLSLHHLLLRAPRLPWSGAGLDRTSAPCSAAGQGRGTHWQPQGTDGGTCTQRGSHATLHTPG